MGLGAAIWRFQWVHLLSNVEGRRVEHPRRVTRLAGLYLLFLGLCFAGLGFWIERLTEKQFVLVIACFIPVNTGLLVAFMVQASRSMK